MFSENWKDGKPKLDKIDGYSGIVKYQRLEQYEDVLNNLQADNNGVTEGLPLKYLFRPQEKHLRSSLNLSKPFNNNIIYGKENIKGKVDIPETYCYLKGYSINSIKTYTINDKYYRVYHTYDNRLIIFRSIKDKEDDSDNINQIMKKYDDIDSFDINSNIDRRKFRSFNVHIITREDFDIGAEWSWSLSKRKSKSKEFYHRFLDEAGDTTFYGKGRPIVGQVSGVSLSFILGSVKFKQKLQPLRDEINNLEEEIVNDPYFKDIPSIQKKVNKNGFYFHATDDIPEVREKFYKFIKKLDVSFEAVVGRKIYDIYNNQHNSKETEFYADLLSHLLKNKYEIGGKLVLNISERGKSTKNHNLINALEKAKERFSKAKPEKEIKTDVVFNVQNPTSEPLLAVADYLCWAVQRVFEKGETRYYDFMEDKISLVVDLYDTTKYPGNKHYYRRNNKLTSLNKLSPP